MTTFLFVTPSYYPYTGGAQTFQRAMVRHLVADGHEVTVLTTNARQAPDFWRPPRLSSALLPLLETIDGATVERLPLSYPAPAPYTFGLLRRAGHLTGRSRILPRVRRATSLFLSRWMPPLPGLNAALRRLAPAADVVQIVDSSWDGPFSAAFRASRHYSASIVAIPLIHLSSADVIARYSMPHQIDVYRQAEAVIALSRREVEALEAWGAGGRVHCLPMGVDPSPPVSPEQLEPGAFLLEHNIASPFVAFVGANTYDKGAFDLAKAVVELNFAGRQVDLVCAGSERELLAAFIDSQPVQWRAVAGRHIRLLGNVDEVTKHRLLAACTVFALPSRVDAYGIVLLEAWLHGKPVIAADAGGLAETVSANENGLLVPFGDISGLKDAINSLITDSRLAARLAAVGFQQVQSRTWEATYRGLQHVYSRVAR